MNADPDALPEPEPVFKRLRHVLELLVGTLITLEVPFSIGAFGEHAWALHDPKELLKIIPTVLMASALAYFNGRCRALFVVREGVLVRSSPFTPRPRDLRGLVPWSRIEGARYRTGWGPLLGSDQFVTHQCFLQVRGRRRPIAFVGSKALVDRLLELRQEHQASPGWPEVADV